MSRARLSLQLALALVIAAVVLLSVGIAGAALIFVRLPVIESELRAELRISAASIAQALDTFAKDCERAVDSDPTTQAGAVSGSRAYTASPTPCELNRTGRDVDAASITAAAQRCVALSSGDERWHWSLIRNMDEQVALAGC